MLIDTSGWLSLYHEGEAEHAAAKDAFNAGHLFITTNYAHKRGFSRQKCLAFGIEVLRDQNIEVVWIDDDLHLRAVELLTARLDKTYSLCDAVSFIIMRDRNLTDALTTDKHFEQEGFTRLLK